MSFFFVGIFFLVANSFCFDNDVFLEGKKEYENLVAYSAQPRYGPCWAHVLEQVKVGCRKLTEDVQHKLALGFTNCFLAKTGRATYEGCEDEHVDTSGCVSQMDSGAFSAYTEFFNHAQSLCYYLENLRWQENAERSVRKLIEQTENFEQRLREWNFSVLSFENRTLSMQEQMIEAGQRLSSSLEQSQTAVAMMHQASADQHAIIRDVFRQLTNLQDMVVDEFSGFYAYAYYVGSTGLAYMLTSTARTESARVPLLTVTSLTFCVERFFLKQILITFQQFRGVAEEVNALLLHTAVWYLRRFAVFICLIVLSWSALKYRDLHAINNSLLEGVAREQRRLRRIYDYQIEYLRDALHRERRSRTPRYDKDATPKPRNMKLDPVVSPRDADDEGDGGEIDKEGTTSVRSSVSRYNLRNSSVRELTPMSTVSRKSSRSRSRSRSVLKAQQQTPQTLEESETGKMARRTPRSTRRTKVDG